MPTLKFIIYILILSLLYSCAPINKQHGYLLDDLLYASKDFKILDSEKANKDNVLSILGSPSIVVKDVDDVWIYLLSVKENNVFKKDEINFQTILRFQFDNSDNLIKRDTLNEENFTEIAFSNEKTKIARDAYGISDQIYDAFVRGY